MNTHRATLFILPVPLEFEGTLEHLYFRYTRAGGSSGLFIGTPLVDRGDFLAIMGPEGIIGQIAPIGPRHHREIH